MSGRWGAAILCALVVLLGSCSAPPLFLFFLDPYTAQLEPGLAAGRRPLAAELEAEFRTATAVRPLSASVEQELRALVASRRPSVVYVSPLFALDPERLLAEFPQVTFVAPRRLAVGPGWVSVRFEHEAALRAAGRLAAALAPRLPGQLGAGRVGILVAGSTPWLSDRVAAFREGCADGGGGGPPVYRQIDGANDRVRARQLMDEMRQEGVGVFLLLTYSLTGFCLEYLQRHGALAIAQRPEAAAAYPESVLLYLEEDSAGVLPSLLDLARQGLLSDRDRAPGLVSAPVRLRSGPALQALPADTLAALAPLAGEGGLEGLAGPEGGGRP